MPSGCVRSARTASAHAHVLTSPARLQINRDRFVLSNGHGCALQYIMLHLLGYNLSMDDLKSFRWVLRARHLLH